MVRLAFVGSVTWEPPSGPPVRFQITQLSVLPKMASPLRAASRTPLTFSRIHLDLPAREVRGGRQARLAPDHVAALVTVKRAGDAVGAGVLPDDGVVVGDGRSCRFQTTVVSR